MQRKALGSGLTHILVDACLVSISWLSAYAIRSALSPLFGQTLNPFGAYLQALPLIVGAWLLSCRLFGVYRKARGTSSIERIQDLLKSVLLGFLLISTIGFMIKEWDFGRAVVLLSTFLNLFLLSASWYAFREPRQGSQSRIGSLVLGTGTTAIRVLQRLQDHPEKGYQVVGLLGTDEQAPQQLDGYPVLGGLDALLPILQEHDIEEVFVACPEIDSERIFAMITACEHLEVHFWMVTDAFKVLHSGQQPLNQIGDLPLVPLSGEPPFWAYSLLKRLFDLSASAVLLVLSLPLWLYWAARIKLDSPGPVFFVQERCGLQGERFQMYKFRTMGVDVDPYEVAPKQRGDARVTEYGAWLRRTSIDEIPQLLNVLKGEMSLVGPRPEMPFIVDTYEDWQRCRLSVKPGLTGLWQILGRKDLPMHDNLQYDFYYIRNRSFSLDISILIRTVAVVFGGKGAF